MKRRLKVNGVIIFVICLLLLIFPVAFFRNGQNIQYSLVRDVFGIAFILLGQLFRASGRGFKSDNSGSGHFLIQSGPYAFVRNPMYLGIFLIGLGIIVTLFKWWALIIFLLVFAIRYIVLIVTEEKKLQAMFAPDYLNYQQRVPRVIPSITKILKTDISAYLPLRISWLNREVGSILAVLFLVVILKFWQGMQNQSLDACLMEITAIIITVSLFLTITVYLIKKTERDVSSKG